MERISRLSTKLNTVSGAEPSIGAAVAVGVANTIQLTLLLTKVTSVADPILSAQCQASNDGQNWTLLGTVDATVAELGQPVLQAFPIAAARYRIVVATSPDNLATFATEVMLSKQ
jgi:hypothetical protein